MLFSGSLSDGAEIRGTVIFSNRKFDSNLTYSMAPASAESPQWLPLSTLPPLPQQPLTSGRLTHTHTHIYMEKQTRRVKWFIGIHGWRIYSNEYGPSHLVLWSMGHHFWSAHQSTAKDAMSPGATSNGVDIPQFLHPSILNHGFSEALQDWDSVAHSSRPTNQCILYYLLSLSRVTITTLCLVLTGMTYQINYLNPNSYLMVCIWKNPI